VREIAKVWGVPPKDITRITRQLPWGWDDQPISEIVKNDPRARHLPVNEEPWRSIFDLAGQINGFPKHLGIHAGGIVISPTPLTDFVPLQPAAKEIASGRVVVTQWDMYPIEDAGLVKIDLLGNRSLAVIKDVIHAVHKNTGKQIDYTRFDPTQDQRTQQIIRRGETMGCFYIESPSMRNLLLKLDCCTFDGLVAASSIIRPGIASSGMMQQYIIRSLHNRHRDNHADSWYLHPLMRQALGETFGVMAYQEDVLKVAMMVARMSPEDSDGLRKAMSKKRDFVAIEGYRRQFITGALAHGCRLDTVKELWRQIESFAGYSFCKAHSASFALVSYQSAYLRAHHPAEFMAAVLSNHGGYYSTRSYISEAQRLGLRILPPRVNESELDFTGADDWVRIGLAQLQHVHHDNLERLVDERNRHGPFNDFADFLQRVLLPPSEVDSLIRAGVLDCIAGGLNRPQLVRQHALYQACGPEGKGGSPGLFGPSALPPVPPVRDYTHEQKLAAENETLGFVVSVHPLQMFADKFRRFPTVKATDLARYIGRSIRLAGWQVTRKRLRTKQKEPMAFITFEDDTALYETVVFPREYRRFAPIISAPGPFLVAGEVTEELGALTVTVSGLQLLADTQFSGERIPAKTIWQDELAA
ncbi:DNA polymerase III subunit alpha, partial [Candidatus Zixiibacteriota bacterium]